MLSDAERRMRMGGAKKEGIGMMLSIIFHLLLWVGLPIYHTISYISRYGW